MAADRRPSARGWRSGSPCDISGFAGWRTNCPPGPERVADNVSARPVRVADTSATAAAHGGGPATVRQGVAERIASRYQRLRRVADKLSAKSRAGGGHVRHRRRTWRRTGGRPPGGGGADCLAISAASPSGGQRVRQACEGGGDALHLCTAFMYCNTPILAGRVTSGGGWRAIGGRPDDIEPSCPQGVLLPPSLPPGLPT